MDRPCPVVGEVDPVTGLLGTVAGNGSAAFTGDGIAANTAGNIGNTLFGAAAGWSVFGITGLQGYSALAYLANDMFTNGVGNSALQSSISQALWYLTSVAIGRGFGLDEHDAYLK